MKDICIYPAIFHLEEDKSYWVEFPDFPLANTQGENLEDALCIAKDCLAGYIAQMEEEGQEIPEPTIPYIVKLDNNSFVQLIEAYLPPYRDEYYNKIEQKNITVPRWLNQIAKKKNINCSALFVSALKKELGLLK